EASIPITRSCKTSMSAAAFRATSGSMQPDCPRLLTGRSPAYQGRMISRGRRRSRLMNRAVYMRWQDRVELLDFHVAKGNGDFPAVAEEKMFPPAVGRACHLFDLVIEPEWRRPDETGLGR